MSVCDHEFRDNIIKVQCSCETADYFDDFMTKLIVNNKTDAWKTGINLFFFYNNKSNKNHEFMRVFVTGNIK